MKLIFATFGDIKSPNFIPYFIRSTPESMACDNLSRWSPADIPSGKRVHNYGKSPFSMGKSTISMAIFYVANCQSLPEGSCSDTKPWLSSSAKHTPYARRTNAPPCRRVRVSATHGWFSRRIRIIRLKWVQGPLVTLSDSLGRAAIAKGSNFCLKLDGFIPFYTISLDHLLDAYFCWLNPPFIITLW